MGEYINAMSHKYEILIVDDNLGNLQILKRILEEQGYIVRPASNGTIALKSVSKRIPDLILLDVKLPDINGFEICKKLKAESITSKIPVIFISAYGETKEIVKGFKVGGVDYITKPFEPEEVVARIMTHVRLQELTDHLEFKVDERTHKLKIINDQLQEEIVERKIIEERLNSSIQEKEILLRELYHRTRNTMLFILSVLKLQACMVSDNDQVQKIVKDIEVRIHTISLVHQMLFESQNLSRIDFRDYVDNLLTLSVQNYNSFCKDISINADIVDVNVLLDAAIPCGLVLNELISNSTQHAFPDKKNGMISLSINRNEKDNIVLTYSDNGIGVPDDFNFRKQDDTLGMKIIVAIVEHQLNGKISILKNEGLTFKIEFSDTKFKERIKL